jgi:putative ABC transport system permease protein
VGARGFAAELRQSLRGLWKAPLFAATAVLTLALGIGVSAAMFSVLDAELLRPLPFREPGRLVRVAERNDALQLADWTASALNYVSWRERSSSFERMGAVGYASVALTGSGEPEQLAANTVTPALFALLGLRPLVGREFGEDEAAPDGARVAMIGEALWRRRFAARASVVGESVTLDGEPFVVVGVAPESVALVAGGDLFTPLRIDPRKENRLNHVITAVGRLRPGVDALGAQRQMDVLAAQLRAEYPELRDWGVRIVPFAEWFVPASLRTSLLVLMGAVALVLGTACANVSGLQLARAVARRQETAVRLSLGARISDVVRLVLAESLVVACVGGLVGVALARLFVRAANAWLPAGLLPVTGIAVDARALAFGAGCASLAAVLSGVVPAWYAARATLSDVLKQGGRSLAGHGPAHRRLVAGELALATVLLVGAGLMLATLERLQRVPLGFDATHLLTFQVAPPASRYGDLAHGVAFYERLLAELEALPGVESAAISSGLPFGNGAYTRTPIAPVGRSALAQGASLPIDWRVVSPGYMAALRLRLLSGRFLASQDAASAPLVAVVSQQTATAFWGDESPLGHVVRTVASGREFIVVGVVADGLNASLSQAAIPAIYFSSGQRLWPSMDVVLRTRGEPSAAIAAARAVVQRLDPLLPVASVKTLEQWIGASAAQPRLTAALVGAFAASALAMAAIGVYGVIALSVSRREREMALRLALGARPLVVTRLVLAEGLSIAAWGIALGLAGAAALGRVVSSLLFGVGAHDPFVFVGAALLLAAAATAACYGPARRASRVAPAQTLRE